MCNRGGSGCPRASATRTNIRRFSLAGSAARSFSGPSMSSGLRLAPHHRVFGGFAIYAFGLGNMFPRLPDIKLAMGVQEGVLGLGLIGTPVGTLIALTFASPLLERIGFRRALLTVIPLMAAGYAVAAWAPD